jgi:hypothetical protein
MERLSALRRQVLYPPELRARMCLFIDPKTLPNSPHFATRYKTKENQHNRDKILQLISFAIRFSFCRASRFICSFIREYFLNLSARGLRSQAGPCGVVSRARVMRRHWRSKQELQKPLASVNNRIRRQVPIRCPKPHLEPNKVLYQSPNQMCPSLSGQDLENVSMAIA